MSAAIGVSAAAKGAVTYSKYLGGTLGALGNFIKNGFGHNIAGAARTLVAGGKNADVFFDDVFKADGLWKNFAAAAVVQVPTTLMNVTNLFSDNRRMREIASGTSNFYTSRDAAFNTQMLSALGTASSATMLASGALLGAASSLGKAGNPLAVGLTIGSGVLATGSLIARQLYKWTTIDLPFKANSGLGMLSFNKPIFRVEDPSSPYYMMSQRLEDTVKKRKAEELKYGKSFEGYFDFVENTASKALDFVGA